MHCSIVLLCAVKHTAPRDRAASAAETQTASTAANCIGLGQAGGLFTMRGGCHQSQSQLREGLLAGAPQARSAWHRPDQHLTKYLTPKPKSTCLR